MNPPDWLSHDLYPFTSHTMTLPAGRVHYLDEGQGAPVVMLHGTPSWSFLYRHYLRTLSSDYRCIIPDQLGFGLSEKPSDFAYTPQAHAEVFAAFIEQLDLPRFTLVVHDFGGPIGLAYTLAHPQKIRALVISNTWLWANREMPVRMASCIARSPLGRWLYLQKNISVTGLLRYAGFDKTPARAVYEHYLQPLANPAERLGSWGFAKALAGENTWYEQLWQQRHVLQDIPTLLLWGVRDKLISRAALARWQDALPEADVVKLEVGHFLQEDAPEASSQAVKRFIDAHHSVTLLR